MPVNDLQQNVAYGLSQALLVLPPQPIISVRDPNTTDFAPLGTIWLNTTTPAVFILARIFNNSATWQSPSGGAGIFTTITASGNITSTGGNISATIGSLSAGTTVTAGTGIIATTGNITASTGDINATLGNVNAGGAVTAGTGLTVTSGGAAITGTTTINTTGAATTTIGTGGTGIVAIGNATGNTAVTGSLTTSTTLTATLGNITSTNGEFVASTAGTGITLGGGPRVIAGTGDPSGAVSAPHGSLYLNITGSGVADRAFINNSVGTGTVWVAVTTVT